MKKRRAKRCFQNENGASVLFVVVSLPVMFTLIILTINIGQMIFDRIRLQTTVDACALTAAARQSAGLNEIADLNKSAYDEYKNAQKHLEGKSWSSDSSVLGAYKQQYERFTNTIDATQKSIDFLKKQKRRGIKIDTTLLNALYQKKVQFQGFLGAMDVLSSGLPWENVTELFRAYKHHRNALEKIDSLRKRANGHFYNSAHQYALLVKERTMPDAELFSIGMGGAISEGRLWGANGDLMDYLKRVKIVEPEFWSRPCVKEECAYKIWGSSKYKSTTDRPGKCGSLPEKLATTAKMQTTYMRPPKIPMPLPLTERWQKIESSVTYAAYGLRQPQKPLILGRRLFDFRKSSIYSALPISYRRYIRNYFKKIELPSMTAYAAAKPTGGKVYEKKAQYRPIMVQLNRVPTTIADSRMEH